MREVSSKPLVEYLDDKEVGDVSIGDLRGFVAYLRGRNTRWDNHPCKCQQQGGLSDATVASHIRAVRRLFNFCHQEGIIAENPAARLKQPKPKRGEPKAASMEDLPKLLKATEGDSQLARRDRAMLLTLVDTGCRVGGLVRMRVDDLDLEHGTIYLCEKGDKGRYVFITPITQAALRLWLEVRPTGKGDHVWNTLSSGAGDHLSEQGFREVFRRLKQKANVTGPINPHAWRHAFAREYLKNDGDLASLADVMGHSDVSVTHRAYAIFRTEELQAKHARHSPLARLAIEM